jgi:hypothetical protein
VSGEAPPPEPIGEDLELEELELDTPLDAATASDAIRREYRYATLGLIVGTIVVLAGVVLIVLGFTGAVDITFQSGKNSGKVTTGSLGIVVVLVGAAILVLTRPRVKAKKSG